MSPARPRALGLSVALISFTVLFQELLLIRWLGQQVRALAYFPNLILIASFLGLGIGGLATGARAVRFVWGPALVALAGAAVLLGRAVITQESASEHLWLLYYDAAPGAPVIRGLRLPLLLLFALTAAVFVPLGQALAERLQAFREQGRPLAGYLWDIAGSALGAVAFVVVSFLGTRPPVWLGVLAVLGLLVHAGLVRVVAVAGALAVVALGAWHDRADVYSPYYALTVERKPDAPAVAVLANGSLHQYAMPVQRASTGGSEFTRLAREGYHLPYRLLQRPPRTVLVVGAGTGNDVAVALDAGAERVDAVEIDPQILATGARVHPDRPYDSPRVRRIVADARSYLQSTRETYDLVVFGTLDSMTRLSALSTVRLDNFVYTVEALQAARRRLTPDGGLVLYFMVGKPYLLERLGGLVTEAFDEVPLAIVRDHNVFNTVLMAGPAFAHQDGERRRALAVSVRADADQRVELSRDDWPFFYLEARGISDFYLSLIGAIALLAVLGLLVASPAFRASARQPATADVEMLLLGMAFLLLETRAVTALNLLWGATWLTSAVVLVSIFVVIFAGTLLAARTRLPHGAAVAGLLLSLAVVYAFPLSAALGTGLGVKSLASLLAAGLPIFFAAIVFARRFAARANAAAAFGWNLLGAVLGGLAEFGSMVIGLGHLVAVAAVLYLLAAWLALRRPAALAGATPPGPPPPSAT